MRLNDWRRDAERFEQIDRSFVVSPQADRADEAEEPCYGTCDGCGRRDAPIFPVAKWWLCETCRALPDGAA